MLPRGQSSVRTGSAGITRTGPFQGGSNSDQLGTVLTGAGSTTVVSNIVGISATSLPLPTGAATQATLVSVDTHVQAVTTALGTPMQATGGSVSITGTPAVTVTGSATIIVPTVTYTHTTVTTSTSTAVALAANGSAKFRLFQNLDATDSIFISASVAAVQNSQIVLFPKSSFSMSLVEGNMDTRVFNCIASANTPKLLVTEGV